MEIKENNYILNQKDQQNKFYNMFEQRKQSSKSKENNLTFSMPYELNEQSSIQKSNRKKFQICKQLNNNEKQQQRSISCINSMKKYNSVRDATNVNQNIMNDLELYQTLFKNNQPYVKSQQNNKENDEIKKTQSKFNSAARNKIGNSPYQYLINKQPLNINNALEQNNKTKENNKVQLNNAPNQNNSNALIKIEQQNIIQKHEQTKFQKNDYKNDIQCYQYGELSKSQQNDNNYQYYKQKCEKLEQTLLIQIQKHQKFKENSKEKLKQIKKKLNNVKSIQLDSIKYMHDFKQILLNNLISEGRKAMQVCSQRNFNTQYSRNFDKEILEQRRVIILEDKINSLQQKNQFLENKLNEIKNSILQNIKQNNQRNQLKEKEFYDGGDSSHNQSIQTIYDFEDEQKLNGKIKHNQNIINYSKYIKKQIN